MSCAIASHASSWTPANLPIWVMVSGFYDAQRKSRLLLMLQIYTDDSGDAGSVAAFMAGFLSTAERWASFSDAWKAVLDEWPALDYFKMSEAAGCDGQFYGWSPERRDDRLAKLVEVTREHVD